MNGKNSKLVYSLMAIISILLLSSILGLVSFQNQKELTFKETERANKEAQEADVRTAEAIKLARIADEQKAIALKAQEEAKAAKKDAEEKRVLANEAQRRAQILEIKANEMEAIAIEQQKIAEKESENVRLGKNRELRMRLIAQGKVLAIKSKELDLNPEEEALVAQQAYRFNTNAGGNPSDIDIYNGLHYALIKFNDRLTRNLEGHDKGSVRSLISWLPSKELFSGGNDGRILRWKFQEDGWKVETIMSARTDYQVYSLGISKEKNLLVAAGLSVAKPGNNYLELYDLKNTSAPPKKIFGFTQAVENISISQDGKGFFVIDNAGMNIKWCDFNLVRDAIKPREKIQKIALSLDGKHLAGAGASGALYSWDITSNYFEKVVYKNSASLTAVTFAPDNHQIIIGDADGQIKIILQESNLPPRILTGHRGSIEDIVFNNAGTFMATTSRDRSTRLWNWSKLTDYPIALTDYTGDWATCATFSPDDEQLMIGVYSKDNTAKETIHVWPTKISAMSNSLCKYVTRNMKKDEWENFCGNDLPYERTCDNFKANNK